ncbi:cell wall-binding repeat-containing protein [Clostridium sp. SYSU_GA19001]|uniref:cell wall-binding repeat-containing protein n=1 Tax=Clostridium caldaquaticum TaxID=2940653 RepID=UPI0020774CE2|nr:cell wall-binding repeat-containing protein [Clostridium caldaquaticum]MCM8709424.1 cell wall-binding repeat-containing protein [Clostridium caldaquaticum]
MKNLKKFLLPIVLLAALTLKTHTTFAATSTVRLGGADRYETSVKISQNSWQQSDYIVLASGENFPDGLSAAPLAKKYNAPLILTPGNSMTANIISELKRLGVKNAFLVGGTGVLTHNIENQLKNLNIAVTRIAGADRFGTSIEVAKQIGTSNGVVIASGENFPDALSIAPIAAQKQMPILLTTKNLIPDNVNNFVKTNPASKYYIIGGTGVISDASLISLKGYERLSGLSRYLTNSAVFKRFSSELNLNTVYLANGENFADALSGAAAAAMNSTAIILTNNYSFYNNLDLNNSLNNLPALKILGGTGIISDNIVKEFLNAVSKNSKLVLGYATYYSPNNDTSYTSLTKYASLIDTIATEAFQIDANGNMSANVALHHVNFANSNNITTFAMVHNAFNADTAKSVLEDGNKRKALINNILNALRTYNYKGVNIDIEGVYYYNREHFTALMSELYAALHPLGYKVTVAVPAKTYDNVKNSWSGAYDYAKLASCADQIVLMTYDEHWTGGAAGPIASIGWVQNVINYAVSVIPKEKVLLGLAAYAYDWPSNGGSAKAYGISSAYNLARQYGATVQWDYTSKSPFFTYTDSSGMERIVWFENAESISYKLDIVNNNNLSGVAIWRLGLEDENYWTSIKNKLNK